MKVFAIGDLHLSGNPPTKPMSIFGDHWINHWERIQTHWKEHVQSEDLVFIVGDNSWAMRLEQAAVDLEAIAAMPGQKIMIRGNHDYWWTSANKMNNLMQHRIEFLQGHGMAVGPVGFGGTRGYLCPNDSFFQEDTDRTIYERELLRTETALQEMVQALALRRESHPEEEQTRILLLHYPPFNDHNEPSGFTELLDRYQVDHCIFGHLHDKPSFKRIPSHMGRTQLHLVSADALQFIIKEIL